MIQRQSDQRRRQNGNDDSEAQRQRLNKAFH